MKIRSTVKNANKLMSIMLVFAVSFILTAGFLGVNTVHASSWGDDYPYRGQTAGYDPWGMQKGQCVSFVAWCLHSRNGYEFNRAGKSWIAYEWAGNARSMGFAVDGNPAVGAVAYWNIRNGMSVGHVAWVSAVNGDNVTIQEYNYNYDCRYHTRTINKGNPDAYIHMKDIPIAPPTFPIPSGSAPEIEDGDYIIHSAVGDGRSLGLGDSEENGANIFLRDWRNYGHSIWHLERQSDDSFKIKTRHSGKVVDVAGGHIGNGVNIQLWDDLNTAHQRWYLVGLGDGWYKMVAQHSGYNLDVAGGHNANGTNIFQWSPNANNAQKFRLEKAPEKLSIPTSSAPEIEDGSYIIHSKLSPQQVLSSQNVPSIGLNVFTWENNYHTTQIWQLERQADDSFKIINKHHNAYLDVTRANLGNEINILLWDWYGGENQLWYIVKNDDDTYRFVAKHSGYVIELMGAGTANNTNIQQYRWNGGDEQRFTLERYPAVENSQQENNAGNTDAQTQSNTENNNSNTGAQTNTGSNTIGDNSSSGGSSDNANSGSGAENSSGANSSSSSGNVSGANSSSGGHSGGGGSRSGGGGASRVSSHTQTNSTMSAGGSWQKDGIGWWYTRSDGSYPRNAWLNTGADTWYYFDANGYMCTGWISDSGKWYYLNADGSMARGWINTGGAWYYLRGDGSMATGWVESAGRWYYMNSSGAMLVSTTTPDGYRVGADGAWIK